jgi:hypothetical protein
MKISNIVNGSENNFSGGVWLHNGTTLKGMLLIFGANVNKKYYIASRITLQTHLEQASFISETLFCPT